MFWGHPANRSELPYRNIPYRLLFMEMNTTPHHYGVLLPHSRQRATLRVLGSRASGRLLDSQTLRNHLRTPIFFLFLGGGGI